MPKIIKCYDKDNNYLLSLELPEDVDIFNKIVSLKVVDDTKKVTGFVDNEEVIKVPKTPYPNNTFAQKLYIIFTKGTKSMKDEVIHNLKNDIVSYYKYGYGDYQWIKEHDDDFIFNNINISIIDDTKEIDKDTSIFDILDNIKVTTLSEEFVLTTVYHINKLSHTRKYIDSIDTIKKASVKKAIEKIEPKEEIEKPKKKWWNNLLGIKE